MILSNRYEITNTGLGGGMGDIAVCRDIHLDRKVVVKTIKAGQEDRRLSDERKALLKLRSKHVVQLFDLVEFEDITGNREALVLEFIEGTDLSPGQFPDPEEHLKILWQIACGLQAIHDHGVIHRDIKHNNIRIDNSGVVKILDFGLARTSGVDAKTLSAIGTPGFMAPELWRNSGVSFDQSIDIYAFAATAIILRTGTLPNELLAWPPEPMPDGALTPLLHGCPSDVTELLEAALSRNPSERPDIKTLESSLRRHLLRGRHRGLFVLGEKTHEINAVAHTATITSEGRGSVVIRYDGLKFFIVSTSGSVKVNNSKVESGTELPACCVITFENATSRKFVTFDVSNPEVIS